MAAARNPQRGEQRYNAKFRVSDIQALRRDAAIREECLRKARLITNAKLAEKFEVSPHTIERACGGFETLTKRDIQNIRSLVAERKRLLRKARRLSAKRLAKRHGVHFQTIYKVTSRDAWIHVPDFVEELRK